MIEQSGTHGTKVYTPNPAGYSDARQLELSTGQSASAAAGHSRFGLKGTVIPRSTNLGGSRNKKAHLKADKINVDPGRGGDESFSLDMTKLDEDKIVNSFNSADGVDIRQIAYNTCRLLAGKGNIAFHDEEDFMESPVMPDRPEPVAAYAPLVNGEHIQRESVVKSASFTDVQPERSKPTIEKPRSLSSPSAIFKGNSTMQTVAPPSVIGPSVEPPQYKVTFELAGFGTFETAYHKVIQSDDGVSLILVYDNRFQGGTKYFPGQSDSELFVDVHDLPYVFQVNSPGLKYKVDNLEHCILLIAKKASKTDEF